MDIKIALNLNDSSYMNCANLHFGSQHLSITILLTIPSTSFTLSSLSYHNSSNSLISVKILVNNDRHQPERSSTAPSTIILSLPQISDRSFTISKFLPPLCPDSAVDNHLIHPEFLPNFSPFFTDLEYFPSISPERSQFHCLGKSLKANIWNFSLFWEHIYFAAGSEGLYNILHHLRNKFRIIQIS